MRTLTGCLLAGAGLLACAPAAAQSRFRIGPTGSVIGIQDAVGTGHTFHSLGASVGLLAGEEGEVGLTVSRYNDLSFNACARSLTLYGFDSFFYPLGPRGLAPFASTELGLARVTDSDRSLLGLCGSATTSSQLSLGFGLGLRLSAGGNAAGILEGRFFQVPNSAIQSLEARANLSLAFGKPKPGQFLEGTVGPALSYLVPVSGPLRARSPFVGVRFQRETKKSGSVGLQLDFAPMKVVGSCNPPGCEPNAILFAPGYEASQHFSWGRSYAEAGLLLAGFYSEGPDRGVAQGLQGGIGVDLTGGQALWNLNARLLWLQRNTGQNVFGVEVGASVSPKVAKRRAPVPAH